MRDKLDKPLPETTQAPPASPIFDPRNWVPLTPAFGQFMSMIQARDLTLICVNRCVHEWQLRLLLVRLDGTTWKPDASECQKLTVHAPHNFEEGVRIEPDHEGRWYVCRSDLAKLTTFPATPAMPADRQLYADGGPEPAVRAEESMPEPNPAVEPELAPPSLQVEPASPPAPKKRARKKTVYESPQGTRAGAVLGRIFKDGNYPTKTEVVWADLWDQFCKEYARYLKDKPSKLPMPSQRTVRRKLGWE
jgi:hypothetical protein